MGYTKYDYRVIKLDKKAAFSRADDPMKVVRKEWDKALETAKYWHLPAMRKRFFGENEHVARQVRPTIIMESNTKGATFATAQHFEGVPLGDNEADLKSLELEYERRYKQATLENTSNRVKMMLGMLGDVQAIDSEDVSYRDMNMFRYNKNYKLFKVKDCTLLLFEPEEVP